MHTTNVTLDWLSVSIPIQALTSLPQALWLSNVLNAFDELSGKALPRPFFEPLWELGPGRPPYHVRWRAPTFGCTIFAHPDMSKALLEFSGVGCHWLSEGTSVLLVLDRLQNHATRLDLAVDLLTEASPQDFVATRGETRHETTAHIESRTGTTCYVGSQRSDRYARVYRYAAPLPRSDLLRVEHVFRREQARAICGAIASDGLQAVAAYCQSIYAWEHVAWAFDESTTVFNGVRGLAHRRANSVLWLIRQVFPAMKRMEREGVLCDLECFLDHWLFEIGDCMIDCQDPEGARSVWSRLGIDAKESQPDA